MKYYWVFILLLACTSTQDNQKIASEDTSILIRDVSVIDVRNGSIQTHQYLIIRNGKIESIRDHDKGSEGMTSIDGSNKYVFPGLAEMHAHIPTPKNGREYIEETLFLYLSNGVTTIRGMLGHPIHLELREEAIHQSIVSPRIYTSSPSLNGRSVQTVEEARKKVNDYADAGYDFLKLHPGIKDEVFDEIVITAKNKNIEFSGHVSVDVGIRKAIKSKYASIDHVDGYLEGLVHQTTEIDPQENGFFGYNFTELADTSLISELVSLTKRHEVWVVPTQSLFDRWFSPQDPNLLASEPEMRYIWKSTLQSWIDSKNQLIGDADYSAEQWEHFNTIRRKIILELQKNGHGLVLGSDAPQVFNVPGFSIHHELESMIKAGLSPLEALQSGTVNAAEFLDERGNWGEILEGASADLMLLDGNPLEDLSNLKNPAGVMLRGKWLDREFIQQELEKIAARSKDK